MPVRTLSNARRKLVDPAVNADERASLVGPRFFSRWSSCMPSLSRRPMSDTALVSGVGCAGSQMSKRTGSVAWSHCWKAAVDRSSLTQGREKLETVLETVRIWIRKGQSLAIPLYISEWNAPFVPVRAISALPALAKKSAYLTEAAKRRKFSDPAFTTTRKASRTQCRAQVLLELPKSHRN